MLGQIVGDQNTLSSIGLDSEQMSTLQNLTSKLQSNINAPTFDPTATSAPVFYPSNLPPSFTPSSNGNQEQ